MRTATETDASTDGAYVLSYAKQPGAGVCIGVAMYALAMVAGCLFLRIDLYLEDICCPAAMPIDYEMIVFRRTEWGWDRVILNVRFDGLGCWRMPTIQKHFVVTSTPIYV